MAPPARGVAAALRPRSDARVDLRADLRAAAEALLCGATGATRVTRLCPVCGSSAHGRPRLVGSPLAVSLSYAEGLVAIAWGAGPIGVDVERAHRPEASELLEWTRVEALAKAAGTGLRDWPDLTVPDVPTRRLTLPGGYVGTLAGDGEVRLAGPGAARP